MRKHSSNAPPDQASNSRQRVVLQAYQLFREKGYYHTSMADIGEACGMLKGSLYHHFANKENLMQAVLEEAYQQFREKVLDLADQKHTPPQERLQQMLTEMDALYFEEQGGCLMARMGLEVANKVPEFTPIIRSYFDEWMEAFDQLFQHQHSPAQARELARRAVGELEGAILLACIYEDKSYFTLTSQRIAAYLK